MEPSWREEGDAALPDSVAVRARRIEDVSALTAVDRFDAPRCFWTGETTSLAAGGEAVAIAAGGTDRTSRIRDAGTKLLAGADVPSDVPATARPRLYGGFSFHGGALPESWRGFDPARFVLPTVQVVETGEDVWLTACGRGPSGVERASDRLDRWVETLRAADPVAADGSPGVRATRPVQSRERWIDGVETTIERIRAGRFRKVVLANAIEVDLQRPISVASVLSRLGERYPDCFRYLFEPQSGARFFGATPERLVTKRGESLRTEALAGSSPRGDEPTRDRALADRLRDSEKNAHEHALVVRAIRDQLRSRVRSLDLRDRRIRTLANVHHLETPIRATVDQDRHVLEYVAALHPTPAVGGLPPDDAVAAIRETEGFDRGWYAAPVGWFDATGDGTFAVAIRGALARDASVRTFAGAGIVADSDPAAEWDEIRVKARSILEVLE